MEYTNLIHARLKEFGESWNAFAHRAGVSRVTHPLAAPPAPLVTTPRRDAARARQGRGPG